MNHDPLTFSGNKEIWKKKIETELKGITYDDLSKDDRNGIRRTPFYAIEDRQRKALNSTMRLDWEISSNIIVDDVCAANKEALSLLGFGASGLVFEFNEMESVNYNDLLKGIAIKYIHICFKFRNDQVHLCRSLRGFIKEQDIQFSDLNCVILFDPIETLIASKTINDNIILNNAEEIKAIQSDTRCVAVDGTIYNNIGTNTVFELACILAQVNEYIHFNQQSSASTIIDKLYVTTAVDINHFEQIAKLRALRALTEFLLEKYELKPDVHIHAETSEINISPLDVNSNLLRTSIMGSAAALGGCDSVLILPYTDKNKSAARLAINQQLIFKEESHFNKITDPAAGSYYLECLTERLAEEAWSHFKAIEKRGGLIASLSDGFVQQQISLQRDALLKDYKDGKGVLIGVNKHVMEDELSNYKKGLDLNENQNDLSFLSIAKELVKS